MQMIEDKARPDLLAINANEEDAAKLQKWISNLNKDLQELGYTYKFELSIDSNDVFLNSL